MNTTLPKILWTLSFLGFACTLTGQQIASNLGRPIIQNFDKHAYQGGTQNWDIAQSGNGYIYVANNEGLLQYNGAEWQIYPLPNQTIVRSVEVDSANRIFVGGQNAFGYFQVHDTIGLQYHSLVDRIPKPYRNFEDVWDLTLHNDQIYFRASQRLYQFANGEFKVFDDQEIVFLTAFRDDLIIQNSDLRLSKFDGEEYVSWDESDRRLPGQASSIVGLDADTAIVFLLNHDPVLVPERDRGWSDGIGSQSLAAFTAQERDDGFAIASISGGLLITDFGGAVRYRLSRTNGLQNNVVLSVLNDRQGNIWLGLDNGVDLIHLDSPISYVYPDGDQRGTGYAATTFQEALYFGTNTGLYTIPEKPTYDPDRINFTRVRNSEGQVWAVKALDQMLLLASHNGAFKVQNNTALRIGPQTGTWTFVRLSKFPDYVVAGTYAGLHLYRLDGDNIRFVCKMAGLEESSRILTQDAQGNLWMSHPYRGIYRIALYPGLCRVEYEFYNSDKGLPDDLHNSVSTLNDEILAATVSGMYSFDQDAEIFEPYAPFLDLTGHSQRIKWSMQNKGGMWFVDEQAVGRIAVVQKGLEIDMQRTVFPGLEPFMVAGFEFIYPYQADFALIGAEEGFIKFNLAKSRNSDAMINCVLESVIVHEGGIEPAATSLFRNSDDQYVTSEPGEFEASTRNVEFSFTAPVFDFDRQIMFQSWLEGFDEAWSEWNVENYKAYTNLRAGEYTFHVKSGFPGGSESEVVSYRFKILKHWYASALALAIYAFLLIGGIVVLVFYPQKALKQQVAHLESENKKQEEQHHIRMTEAQNRLMKLKNEKLRNEVQHKNQELASVTMHLVQKNELMHRLENELQGLRKLKDGEHRKHLDQLIRLLAQNQNLDDDWERFSYHFDQVHSDFLKRLGNSYPQLTPNDHKMCSYLRMNLTTKEIAPLLNISVRGVEISRYRLRKKLALESSQNLNEFMMQF